MGRPVTFAEVFLRAHTRKDGTFVDLKAEQVADAYKKNKEAKLALLQTDNGEVSDGLPPLTVEEDNEIFLQVKLFFGIWLMMRLYVCPGLITLVFSLCSLPS